MELNTKFYQNISYRSTYWTTSIRDCESRLIVRLIPIVTFLYKNEELQDAASSCIANIRHIALAHIKAEQDRLVRDEATAHQQTESQLPQSPRPPSPSAMFHRPQDFYNFDSAANKSGAKTPTPRSLGAFDAEDNFK